MKTVIVEKDQIERVSDQGVTHQGTKIVLPAKPKPMEIDEAIVALKRVKKDQEKIVEPVEWVDAYPLDAACAFMYAMKETFGWVSPVPIPPKSFFDVERKPQLIGVPISPTETMQVIFGRFELPNIRGNLETGIGMSPEREVQFVIKGELEKKNAYLVAELAKRTREIVKTDSIYKGKAIKIKTDEDNQITPDTAPKFLDVSTIDPDEVILNRDILEIVETSLYTPIRETEKCRSVHIPLNRSVLLEGTYGVGKTLIARATSRICVDNGWTFIMLENARQLRPALLFAQRYSPAVVFCEDIDRVTSERDEDANDLLNIIDGILTKDAEVIAVMTTNHVENINQAMLRHGRMDAVVTITKPNAESIEKLIRLFAGDLLKEEEPLTEVCKELVGCIPATIREVVERSKLRGVQRINGHGLYINKDDLMAAAKEMKYHLELVNRPTEKIDPIQKISQGLGELLEGTELGEKVSEISENLQDVKDYLDA